MHAITGAVDLWHKKQKTFGDILWSTMVLHVFAYELLVLWKSYDGIKWPSHSNSFLFCKWLWIVTGESICCELCKNKYDYDWLGTYYDLWSIHSMPACSQMFLKRIYFLMHSDLSFTCKHCFKTKSFSKQLSKSWFFFFLKQHFSNSNNNNSS